MSETTENSAYHIPVLLSQSVDGLNIRPDGIYVDATFGGGGHSREILRRLNGKGCLFSFDLDEDVTSHIIDDARFTFVRSNFRFIRNFLRYYNVRQVDGILADLGVSSHHFDDAERGFSFRFDADLDMRMNRFATKTAAGILNEYSEEQLANIFFFAGELKNARQIAASIVAFRANNSIKTTEQLIDIVTPLLYKRKEKKMLAQVFQALRIEVNDELEALRDLLWQSVELLVPGGRLSIISYHSLEDRLVKNFIRTGNFEGHVEKDFFGNIETPFEAINRKVIVASDEEVERNPRSRSAKLRIAEKTKR